MDLFSWIQKGPSVTVTVTERVISEPVASFVKTFMDNPKRFESVKELHTYGYKWTLTDKENGKVFDRYSLIGDVIYPELDFLPREDLDWAFSEISNYYSNRKNRLEHLKALRLKRELTREYVKRDEYGN